MTGKAENTGSENFSGMPLYRRAALQLQELIVRDGLQPGDRLPSSRELQKRFGVSLVTIEAGMKLLVESGVLSRRPRLGTFVANGSAGGPLHCALPTSAWTWIFCQEYPIMTVV